MSELVVVGFKDPEEADRVLLRLSKLKREYLIDIEDAVVVVRDETGKVHLKQSINLVTAGATSGFISGSLWGTFVGLCYFSIRLRDSSWAALLGSVPGPCPA